MRINSLFGLRFLHWPTWFVPVVMLITCGVVYCSVLAYGFCFDDHILLFGQEGMAGKTFGGLFTGHQGLFYRPVGHIVMWLSRWAFGANPAGYRLVNILLLSAAASLFFYLAVLWGSEKKTALLAVLLFILHPFNGFLVNYITASSLLTLVLLLQGAFLCFIFFDNGWGRRWFFLALLFYVMAILTHESAAAFVFFLLMYYFFLCQKPKSFLVQRGWFFLAPFAVLAVVFVLFRRADFLFARTLGGASAAFIDPVGSTATWMKLAGWYVQKLFLPRDVLFLWSEPFQREYSLLMVAELLAGAIFIGYLLFVRWKKGVRPFALALFLAGLLFTVPAAFSYFPIIQPFIEPHWMLFASFGFFLLAASGLASIVRWHRFAGYAVTAFLLTFLFFSALTHNANWVNQETYARFWLKHNQGNLTPFYGLGRSLMDKGDIRGALAVFTRGFVRLKTHNVYILANAAHCYDLLEDDGNALALFNAAIKENSRYAMTYVYLGHFWSRRGQKELARQAFDRAFVLDPTTEKRNLEIPQQSSNPGR